VNRITRRLWTVATAALTLAALSCGSEADAEDPSLIQGRMWFAKMPEKPTEHVHGLFIVPRPKRGVFSNSSAYDLHLEVFEYAREESKVKLKFPQSDKKAEFSYTIKKCDEEPFDICLDLDKNPWGGPKRYYARLGGSGGELAAREAALLGAASIEVD
jgi:hypothetical protein